MNIRRGSGNGSQTHCPKDHPYSGDNLKVYRGMRYCRACKAEANAARIDPKGCVT